MNYEIQYRSNSESTVWLKIMIISTSTSLRADAQARCDIRNAKYGWTKYRVIEKQA